MYDPCDFKTRNLAPVIVSVTHLLEKNNCTYDEADWIVAQLKHWLYDSRQETEYATTHDYFCDNKTTCADDIVVKPMGYVDSNLNAVYKDGTPMT